MLVVRRVVGQSMLPALQPGQVVVGFRSAKLRPGDLVIFRHAGIEKIKRVEQLEQERLFVVGDNPGQSTDSRQFGWIPASAAVARIVWPANKPNNAV